MFKNNRWIGIFTAFLFGVSLLATQMAYASQKEEQKKEKAVEADSQEPNNETKGNQENYDTILVGYSDYVENSVLKDISWIFPKHDSLFVTEQDTILVQYLVVNGQEVKQGDRLLSYEIPVDSIALEEMRISLDRKESGYRNEIKNKEAYIKELRDKFQLMDYSTIDAQIQALNINKLEIELEQFKIQTTQDLEKTRASVKELKDRQEAQYIEAPYDGMVVINENYKEGIKIEAFQELLHIYDTKSAVLGTEITGVNKFWYGMEVSITGISNMKEDKLNIHNGKVVSVDTLYNGKVNTGMIYIQPEEPDLFSNVQKANISAVSVDVKDVLVIPVKVVKFENDMSYVYILDDKDEIRKQYVSGRENGTDMWVYSGLSEGQRIVVE